MNRQHPFSPQINRKHQQHISVSPSSVDDQKEKKRAEIFSILSCVRNRVAPHVVVAVEEAEEEEFGNVGENLVDDDDERCDGHASEASTFRFGDAVDEKLAHTDFIDEPTLMPAQQQQHRRRSSNFAVPSTARVAERISRKNTTLMEEKSHGHEKLHPSVKRMQEVLSEELKSFCGQTDAVMQLALAGVPGVEYEERIIGDARDDDDQQLWLKHRQEKEALLYSSLLEGTRPWEVLGGTVLLPSYAVLHPNEEWKECDPEGVPRELMEFFVRS